MADPVPTQQGVSDATSSTVTIVSTDTQDGDVPTLTLRLKKPKNDKKVQWTTETVDNEDMNKKKSKCCCIYNKPKKFDESSSSDDSDDECDHCHGHVEKKKLKKTTNISAPVETLDSIPNSNDSQPDRYPNPEPAASN